MMSQEELENHIRHEVPLRYADAISDADDYRVGDDEHHTPVPSAKFNVDNDQAVPVYERATSSYSEGSMAIGAGSFALLGRHRGRKSVVLSAPVTITVAGTATTPAGFQWSHDRNKIDTGSGFQMNPGDSAQIDSEAEVWVGPLPGKTTGYVQFLELFNVLGGPAGS